MLRLPRSAVYGALAVVALVVPGCASDDGSYPPSRVDLVASADPGGGVDLFTREIARVLDAESLTDSRLKVVNVGGGGGNAAMAAAAQGEGDGVPLVMNTNRVYLNKIAGTTDLTSGKSFTPIAQLITEYEVLAVRSGSKSKDAAGVIDALRRDPSSISFGVGSIPSDDQLHLLQLAEKIGVDPAKLNIVAFSAGGDLVTQLLGGHVDVISTGLSEALPQVKAGDVRVLATSAPKDSGGTVGDYPSWQEQGVDLVLEHWRGVFGPPEMSQDQITYWQQVFTKMTGSDAWQAVLKRNEWTGINRGSEAFAKRLVEESTAAERLLRDVGLVRK